MIQVLVIKLFISWELLRHVTSLTSASPSNHHQKKRTKLRNLVHLEISIPSLCWGRANESVTVSSTWLCLLPPTEMLGCGQPMSNYRMLITASLGCTCIQVNGYTQEAHCGRKQARNRLCGSTTISGKLKRWGGSSSTKVSGSPWILAEVQTTIRVYKC